MDPVKLWSRVFSVLSQEQAVIVDLHFASSIPLPEIAEKLDAPLAHVRAELAKALETLHEDQQIREAAVASLYGSAAEGRKIGNKKDNN